MHIADYDGSLAQERDRRVRRDNIRAILFGAGFLAVVAIVGWAVMKTVDWGSNSLRRRA